MTSKRNLLLVTVAAAAVFGAQGTSAAADPAPREAELESVTAGGEALPPLSLPEAREAAAQSPKQAPQARTADVATAAAVNSGGSAFTPMTPTRVLDTRTEGGAIGPGSTRELVLHRLLPMNATAVVLNVTAVAPSQATYLTVWPAGAQQQPAVSSINVRAGEIRANAVTVGLNATGGPQFFLNIYNSAGSSHVVVDVAGYYAPDTGSRFTAQSPARVLDTRTSGGVLPPGGTRTINLSSRLPASATAVTFNLTGIGATTATYVTAYPTGAARPNASTLNLVPGAITPNLVTVPLGTNRSVTLYNNSGNVHLIADLAGYYATDRGNPFYQLTHTRVIDTRSGGALQGGFYYPISLATELPPSTSAVTFNLTGIAGSVETYLTAFPGGTSVPNASNVNLAARQVAANQVTVAVDANRNVNLFNAQGNAHALMDLAGYFAPPPAACAASCVYSWGDNEEAQLGVGTTGGFSTEPGRVDGVSGVAAVTSSYVNGYALGNDGTVRAWGSNGLQGLGNGELYGVGTTPGRVGTLSGITQLAAGSYSGYALNNAGEVWGWGYNGDGSLGDGSVATRATPVRVNIAPGVTQIAAGYTTAYALQADGTVWAWGSNGGSLGNGFYGTGCETIPVGPGCRAVTPIQVPGLTDVVSIASTRSAAFAVKSDGTVWAWGYNAHGELGIGAVGGRKCYDNPVDTDCGALSPVQIPGLTDVTKVASGSGSTTYALKSDGTVLSWGFNGNAELGNGTAGEGCTDPSVPNCAAASPGPVSGLTGVTDVAGGASYGMARGSDGSVWTWGRNTQGQLGHAPELVPAQVPGLTGVTAIGSGGATSFAVR